MTIIIRGVPGSPFGRACLMALIEKGAPHRLEPVSPFAMKTPEHFARHPFGRVPVMEHGDFHLYETQAIIRYVDLAFDGPSLVPGGAKAQARMQQVMNVHDWYAFPTMGAGIAFNRIVAPRLGFPVNDQAVIDAIPQSKVCQAALEALLGDNPYFTGDTLSLADLHVAPLMDMLDESPEGSELLKGSKLGAWTKRMQARPAMAATTWDALLEAVAA